MCWSRRNESQKKQMQQTFTEKYKTRCDMGKMVHWELCKKFTFDHTNKWYEHNPEFILENEMYQLLWDFEIQTNHLI